MHKKILVALAVGVLCFSAPHVLAQEGNDDENGTGQEPVETDPTETGPNENELPVGPIENEEPAEGPADEEDDGNIVENVNEELAFPGEEENIIEETVTENPDDDLPPVQEQPEENPVEEQPTDGTVIIGDGTLSGNILATSALATLAALLVI